MLLVVMDVYCVEYVILVWCVDFEVVFVVLEVVVYV